MQAVSAKRKYSLFVSMTRKVQVKKTQSLGLGGEACRGPELGIGDVERRRGRGWWRWQRLSGARRWGRAGLVRVGVVADHFGRNHERRNEEAVAQ